MIFAPTRCFPHFQSFARQIPTPPVSLPPTFYLWPFFDSAFRDLYVGSSPCSSFPCPPASVFGFRTAPALRRDLVLFSPSFATHGDTAPHHLHATHRTDHPPNEESHPQQPNPRTKTRTTPHVKPTHKRQAISTPFTEPVPYFPTRTPPSHPPALSLATPSHYTPP